MQTNTLTSETKEIDQTARRWYPSSAVLFFCLIALSCLAVNNSVFAQESSQAISAQTSSQPTDPNKGPSEFNHHIAGWALIGVGLLALANVLTPTFKSKNYIWPALFVLAGFFLALWSDGEIWPRGNVSWSWLLHHDAEARQHKIYALLLIAIGTVEYIRIRGLLPRFWKKWAFPLIAFIGAGMLLIHDHNSGSGVHSPEVKTYLVDPDLDVDGNPQGLSSSTTATGNEDQHRSMLNCCDPVNASNSGAGHMTMDHSQMDMHASSMSSALASDHHVMTASMIRVERQHLWFMIVGLAIGLFKFISDSEFFRGRIIPCIWPSCAMLLGVLLIFYQE
jgi:hypothetical protein